MALYPGSLWERATKAQEVILRALTGQIRFIEAAPLTSLPWPTPKIYFAAGEMIWQWSTTAEE